MCSHESEFCQSNAVVVQGEAGLALLIDAGVHKDEMSCLVIYNEGAMYSCLRPDTAAMWPKS